MQAESKKIALTFDDGPTEYMDSLLDCLEEYSVRATFFVEGRKLMEHPDTVKRAAEIGCEIGNHSFAHENLAELPLKDAISSVAKTSRLLSLMQKKGRELFRPPYGRYTDELAAQAGMPLVIWSFDTLDWKTKDGNETYARLLEGAQDGSIILAHVHIPSTVEAVKRALPVLLERGCELVTVSEMLVYKYGTVENGVVYR